MGMTIAEKIIAAAAGVDSVKPGDIYTVSLDHLMSNDGTTHLTVDMYNNKLKNPHIADTKKLVFIVDHNVPSDSPKTAASQKKMRDFARENNIDFWEGKGVCHQIMIENYVRPGQLIFGADSHTCSYGALGAFGTGVGCTDFLYGMVTGTSWVMVPETVKFNLTGKLPEGVYARDLILTIIGEIGANGCNYQAMEFTGEGARTLSISDRMALCNMAVEAGAKTGIFEADEKAIEYLKEHGREPKEIFHSDPDAKYVREYTFDLSKVRPVVAKPDFVDRVVPAEETCGTPINEAFLGSCNNGRIEDLRVGAEIIRGKKVAEGVRFLVVPASQTIYRQALKEGIIDTFMEAGAIVMNPNCSVCWGSCQGVIGENEVLISTGTRNFKGRAGHPSSKVYLGSAATVTASAIAGKIATLKKESIEDTLSLITHDDLQKAIQIIKKASCIHLFAVSNNLLITQEFKHNMARIRKDVRIHGLQNEVIFDATLANPDSCALIVSYSGETYVLDNIIKVLKNKNIPVIVITSIGDNTLSRKAECVLRICTREKLYSKIATFSTDSAITYLLDVLYSCIFALDYDRNLNLKIETSKSIETGRFSTVDILKEEEF